MDRNHPERSCHHPPLRGEIKANKPNRHDTDDGEETTDPVPIIGAGPTGATTAHLLSHLGIKSIMISRHHRPANTPRAHILNQRAMDVLCGAGLESTLLPLATLAAPCLMHTSWLRSLAGEEYGRVYPRFHLPHIWVVNDGQSHRILIQDLCEQGWFTVITDTGGDVWGEWARCVEEGRSGLEVRVISIGWRQDYMDAYGDWVKVRGMENDGVVLVRPDRFVAWRCRSRPQDGAAKLLQVFAKVLPSPRPDAV